LADDFSGHIPGLTSPAGNAVAITPHDSNELSNVTRGLYVGVTGDVVVVTANGDEVTLTALAAGVFHPIRVKQVKSTNTTATNIVGVY
jgi:hypothetical protein